MGDQDDTIASGSGDSSDPGCPLDATVELGDAARGDRAAGRTLTEGSVLGRYRIGKQLGSGGMGEVYAAEELDGHRRLALKVISPKFASTVSRARFLREGKLAASINHPNSVYVFRADETGGNLVIAMELMPGGTLADVVAQRGALPHTEAVDATLQIIAGLSAAEARGVLHRDIKPANCFLDSDGTIKIGDYGLSRPTGEEEMTAMTQAGAVMGTPSYAPPEQLRGETVDVRSDIYAVGATLFFLLTGFAPFEGGNAVQVIGAVLSENPKRLDALVAAAPAGLRKVVLACLAKDPARRPQSYRDLEARIREFGSALPQAASPGPRLVAGTIDAVASLIGTLAVAFVIAEVGVRLFGERWITESQSKVFVVALIVSYYGLSEGLFSATPGKLTVGLRVLRSSGRPLGIGWATLRAVIFCAPVILGTWIGAVVWADRVPSATTAYLVTLLEMVSPLLLFVGARADNGWQGLHDRWTRSKVSVRRRDRRVDTLDLPTSGVTPIPEKDRVAGFQVVGRLKEWPEAPLRLARDEVLGRDVWLHDRTAGITTPVERRQLSRPTRLRWIAGVAEDGWDAYEAVDGAPIPSLRKPLSWQRVHGWLCAALDEITEGQDRESPIALVSPRQLWVTQDGRLKLVEPGILGLEAGDGNSWHRAQQVLLQAMGHALAPGDDATEGVPRVPLPLRFRDFLDRLGRGEFANPAQARSALEFRRSTPGSLGKRRAISVGIQAGVPIAAGSIILLYVVLALMFPALLDAQATLNACSKRLAEFDSPDCSRGPDWESQHRALQICVVDGIHKRASLTSRWSKPDDEDRVHEVILRELGGQQEASAHSALEAHPAPTEKEVVWAREQLETLITKSESHTDKVLTSGWFRNVEIASILAVLGLGGIGLAAMFTVPIFRSGLTFRLLGLAIVHRDGAPASRLRCLGRAVITWFLPLVALAVVIGRTWFDLFAPWATRGLSLAVVLIMLSAALWAVFHPSCSVQDRIARTRVVPR